ncbi:LuxR family transcriptional regulator [Mycobacterium sp. ACS1612]|uniref:helix-turn-helix transcriptional regulator n=1 Tax=Mycobacterium sp. ACS1612 TaxID=1834117 RepID=UPI0007FC575C|nr:LuxR family transcriptional regulator [Mycobacterium sp. ACS1612]OBF36268.1 LuxR family transcriptional regulator [Mycobacterium sp. ACS1612]
MISRFLSSARSEPSALLIEGEAGIGKTTLWLEALQLARESGFRVLSARAAAAESVLAYTALADLLDGVPAAAWADLPEPQRFAVDQVLMRADDSTATDQRAVAAAFLSVVGCLSDEGPLLLAIDDLQWIDPSSMHVAAFAARRLSGPVGILGSVRTDADDATSAAWLQLPRPDAVSRVRLHPMGIHDLHTAVSKRLRRSFSRPTMGRIHAESGGNPFYAIELARAIAERTPGVDTSLPSTLADVVQTRLNGLDSDVHDALLAASCLASPTVELVSSATIKDDNRLIELLESAESKGIITIDGNRIQFAHPLLARGVYTEAAPARRRTMHRRLAEIVDEPELRARHLALAATRGDQVTLEALDTAAESARVRGAPAAAAELMDLAIGLGGDTAERRLRSALHHFDAGDQERARLVLEETIDVLAPGELRAEALSRLAVVRLYSDGFFEAAALLRRALAEVKADSPLRVQILITLAYSLLQSGVMHDSVETAEEAVAHAERLKQRHLLGLAMGMRVTLHFLSGAGFDEDQLQFALDLEDPDVFTPLVFRPSVQQALLLEWTGRVDEAHRKLEAVRRHCVEKGEEGELIFIAQHVVLSDIWRGDFVAAGLVADDAMERARQLGGDTPLFLAYSLKANLATYAGREADARQAAAEALEIGRRTGAIRLTDRVIGALGFLEVSLGRYEEAVATLRSLLAKFDPATTSTELPSAIFLPDAIEALIQVNRGDEAEPLIEALERNGERLDRAWVRAVGARGRSMLLAARGDLDAASAAAERAMLQHNRLSMPIERARTLLLLGQLQRRQRRKEAASASLQQALDIFERLHVPLWADRARAELARANVGPRQSGQLTPSEQRVAELAASGMKNRDVATALFISPKTVEANLARIYRKLGIKSRAELGRHMGKT